jgi:hypothetical protein
MAATVDIYERNGTGVIASSTAKTAGTIRFKNADNNAVDSNNPMVIPTSGSDWSFEKWLSLRITGTKPADNISNLRFYTDGTIGFGTGITVWARSATAFSAPAEPTTSTGLTTAGAFTSGSPLSLAGGPWSGTSTFVGSSVVLSMEVTSAATVGALTAETVTWAYDEV